MRRTTCTLLVAALVISIPLLLAGQEPEVVINEIFYEPADKTSPAEFVELHNRGALPADVSGWFFSEGIAYEIPFGVTIPPGGYLVVAEDPPTIRRLYGDLPLVGPYDGRLDNDGETVTLRDAAGDLVDQVDYRAAFPWPIGSMGTGSSMELINPALDNDLGGSWRASGAVSTGSPTRRYLVSAGAAGWRYRKGTSEPPADWRATDFVEDGSWRTGAAGIGYGDGDDATELGDMRNGYSSVYFRRTFTIASAADIPAVLKLGVYADDGAIVWLNGREVGRFHVSAGDKRFDDFAESHEAAWDETVVADTAALLRVGQNVLAAHGLNTSMGSSDFSFDATLFEPAAGEVSAGAPSPGARNSVYAENAPPQIRQVDTVRRMPAADEINIVTVKVTDPDGVAAVDLHYQIVRPGHYVPAFLPVPLGSLMQDANQPRPPDPAFEDPANWTTIPMADDGGGIDEIAGDGVFSAALSGAPNRTLVRYRISATDLPGASVRVPYPDDPSLNFAYFVYNGVPDYHVETSILGRRTTHGAADLTAVPVYILITRNEDIVQARAARSADQIPQGNQARFAENWEGTFVYEGYVYDHITYRLRGANGRYQVPPGNPSGVVGKRHWRFRFNRGNYLRARDRWGNPYPTRWKWLNTGRMFGNRLDGNWGLGDQVNDIIWNAYGVPAAFGHVFHWRVIDGPEEAPGGVQGQYHGDFWGLARAFENYDVRFLEAHRLPKGNLYKLVNQTRNGLEQRRYLAPGGASDGSDHDTIESSLRPERPASWLRAYVEYDEWYHYHAIAQALRHYDYWPEANKNAAWYFYPDYLPENSFRGRMWTLPFDADATWGPTWNAGHDRPYEAIYGGSGKADFQREYREHIREVRDLLWQRDQLEQVIRQTAAFMDPLEEADIDRWRNGTAESGRQYFSASNQRDLEGKIRDMLAFAFTGGSWPGGGVGAGGRAAFLDSLADGPDAGRLPRRPVVAYSGRLGYPIDGLSFLSSPFSDPQGSGTFSAMEWRLAEVTRNPGPLPLADTAWKARPVKLEIEAAWESGVLTAPVLDIAIPPAVVAPGRRYRVRSRMRDTTRLWGHWSLPVEFTAAPPLAPLPAEESLRITEVMFNPPGGADLEFIELQNVGTETLDVRDVRFIGGVDFRFADSDVASLAPGELVVVVRSLTAFSRRYDAAAMRIAGEFSGRLDNGGERITLAFGVAATIMSFVYDDTWYPEADGLGHSVNLADADAGAATWSTAAGWFPSTVLYGTPGAVDPVGGSSAGMLRPGDANTDGVVDVSDALALLVLLFRDRDRAAPCGDDVTAGGNVTLLDINGDAAVDVSDAVSLLEYLFRFGRRPALGVNCVRIEGCPWACGEP